MDHSQSINMPSHSPAEYIYAAPAHGSWRGHVLPGSFFLVWSAWWLCNILRQRAQEELPESGRRVPWYPLTWRGKALPLEPLLMVLLTSVGITAELWAGHKSYRRLYAEDGRFEMGNLQDWQHSAMYAAFLLSGIVDLLGRGILKDTLPHGTEHGVLGSAFLVEGILFAFHLKGSSLDKSVHILLVLLIFAAALVCFAEIGTSHGTAVRGLLPTARALLVMLQGIWFIQAAQILFTGNIAWDPNYHGSTMMVPVVFVTWLMVVLAVALVSFAVVSLAKMHRTGQGFTKP